MPPSDANSGDADLLRAWSRARCEHSFRALVAKYLGLVQGLALRRTGDAALADEIAQNVFARLAVRAGHIAAKPTLAPWLHHCAWCETVSALRRESTRRRHMNAYADHLRVSHDAGAALHAARPHLDEALQSLRGDDQRIVLMRFYEGRGLRDIAAALGKTEAAVRKQGQRALEKLAVRLRRRGVTVSAVALSGGLAAALSHPANATTVAAVTSAAAASAPLHLLQQLSILMNTKTKTALITAACMAVPLTWQWQRAAGLEEKLTAAENTSASLKSQVTLARMRSGGPPGKGAAPVANPSATASSRASATPADWEGALRQPDPLQRSQGLAALMASLTKESAPEVAELFKRLREGESGDKYETDHRNFLRAWGQLDGFAALTSCFGESGAGKGSSEALSALAGWAQTNPDSARAWLDSQADGDAKNHLALGLIDGWALRDFDAASAYAASLPRSTVRDQFRALLMARALDAGGVPAAQRWFDNIPGDDHNSLYKQRAFDELITAMMRRDPAAAADWIARIGRQPFMTGRALSEVASAMAQSSPTGALRWLDSLGTGAGEAATATASGYASVLNSWAQQDPAAAGQWLQSQPSHPAYDGMAQALTRHVAGSDISSALAWADSIQNEALRGEVRREAARAALRAQGDDVRPALLAAGFSENDIKESDISRLEVRRNYRLAAQRAADQLELAYRADELAARAALDASISFSPDGTTLAVGGATDERADVWKDAHLESLADSALRSVVTAQDNGFHRAHPNGAPNANCASCHR